MKPRALRMLPPLPMGADEVMPGAIDLATMSGGSQIANHIPGHTATLAGVSIGLVRAGWPLGRASIGHTEPSPIPGRLR